MANESELKNFELGNHEIKKCVSDLIVCLMGISRRILKERSI